MSKLTKEEAQMYLEDLVKDSCIPVGHMMIKRHHIAESGLRQLIEEHFELLEKYKALQDENGRLNFNNIANNINDMNYKLWLDNPPLKFEELKAYMFVWDEHFNTWGEYLRVVRTYENEYGEKIVEALATGCEEVMTRSFKENRFYRKQVVE